MAIFDSEKRTRGLRMPSMTGMKNGAVSKSSLFKKSESKPATPEEQIYIPPAYTYGASPAPPPQRAPPPNKELPPRPLSQIPPPPKVPTTVPPRRQVSKNATIPPFPAAQPPVIVPESQEQSPYPAGSPVVESPRTQVRAPPSPTAPQPVRPAERPAVIVPSQETYQAYQPAPPVVVSTPEEDNEANTPLEDFIPTPEGPGSPIEEPMREDQPSPFIPPEVTPIPAPLHKVHFTCFQEHRNMPVAQNVWCSLPCQTCHKHDREIRHRCVFCCLRVCASCYQTLQKCQNRSLNELLEKVG
ncbi:hypothetical protein N7540_008599 [Penicillium herquei]|nr:hypothetical protein N7540_008599 [Penicillium herquei]